MNVPFVDLKRQYLSIKDDVTNSIDDVLEKNSYIKGEQVKIFEKSFAALLGVNECISVANGTDALVISLRAVGVGYGDEVIVPANSFIATSEAVGLVGASAVFVDIDPDSFNLDPSKIEAAITQDTKAIIPVHLYGRMAPMDRIMQLAEQYNLSVIEDSAQAHLSEINLPNRSTSYAGTVGHLGAFSFYPGKNLGAYGDGGAIVTSDKDFARFARMYANHGRISKYNHEFEGTNSRLDSIQAAVLNVKLKHIKDWTALRRKAAARYNDRLSLNEHIRIPPTNVKYNSSWHLYVIRTLKREDLRFYLSQHGVSTGIHYPIALPFLKAYKSRSYRETDFPVAHDNQDKILSLPMFPEIKAEEIDYVCDLINRFFSI